MHAALTQLRIQDSIVDSALEHFIPTFVEESPVAGPNTEFGYGSKADLIASRFRLACLDRTPLRMN